MANKQTTPGLVDVQGSYVNSNGNPLIPQTGWKSPLRQVAQIGEEAVVLAKQYQDIKFDGYQAQYSIMANQMYHEMQDATDPTQIDEIQKKYEQKFAQPLEDNIWGKSYLTSQYRRKWDDTVKENTQKIRFAMQHKFNNIELEKTLNSMAMAAASTGDINAMESYFDSSIALIDSKELSVEEKNVLKKNFAANVINYSFNANPNITNSFAQKYAAQLAPYGIDANEIKTKTDNYNIQQENRLHTKKKRAEEAKKTASQKIADEATLQYLKDGNLENFEAKIEEVRVDNPAAAVKMYKIAYPENAKETAKNKAKKNLANKIEEIEEMEDGEEKEKAISEFKELQQESRLLGHIDDSLIKYQNNILGLSPDGTQSIANIAKSMTQNQFEEFVAENGENYTSSQIKYAQKMVDKYSGFDGKKQYIIEQKGLVPNETIKSWGFNEEQTALLMDKAQTERSNNGSGSIESEEILQDLELARVTKDTKRKFLALPESEKEKVRKKAVAILGKTKELYTKRLRLDAFEGKVSDEEIAEAYANDRIEKDDADDLLEIVKYVNGKNIHTISNKIISNILSNVNGKPVYGTQEDLNIDLAKLHGKYDPSNIKEYDSFVDFATDLYTKVNSEFKANVKTVVDNIEDAIVSKNPQFDLDTETRRRLAIFKNMVAKQMTKEYLEGPLAGKAKELAEKYSIINVLPLWDSFSPSKQEIRESIRKTSPTISITNNLEELGGELDKIYIEKTPSGNTDSDNGRDNNSGNNNDNNNESGSIKKFFQKQLDNIKEFLNIKEDSKNETMTLSLTNQGSK